MCSCVLERLALGSWIAAHWLVYLGIKAGLNPTLDVLLHIHVIEVFLVALVVSTIGLVNGSRLAIRAVSMSLGW